MRNRVKYYRIVATFWITFLCLLGISDQSLGDISVPSIISNHAVFQRSEKTRIWGKGTQPSEQVKVSIGNITRETKVDQTGNWQVELDTTKLPEGPFELVIQGTNKLVIADVLIGEVWVCSGQSNMDRRMDLTENFEEEVKNSANNRLREFHVYSKTKDGLEPQDDCNGKWQIASPETTPSITAVGYYFAKEVIQTINKPVGLIHSSVPGTPVEEWMTPESVAKDASLIPTRDKILKEIAENPAKRQAYIAGTHEWEKKHSRTDQPTPDPTIYYGETISPAEWKTIQLPGKLVDQGLPDSGIFWLRKEIDFDAPINNQTWIDIITPGGYETIYWNQQQIVSIKPENMQVPTGARRYWVPKQHIRSGKNVIAIRLHSPMGSAGITGELKRFVAGPISLQGDWLARVQAEFPPIDAALAATYPENPKAPPAAPSRLYNGYIAPVAKSTIRGVLWYQGEANAARGFQYRTTFPGLISGWREKWGHEMPFYFCQLAPIQAKKPQPAESNQSEIRESQLMTLSLPKTGMAVLLDIGETNDIHPRNKKDVGLRLAKIALAKDYGQKIEYSGPIYQSMKIEGDKIRLKFNHIGSGLYAKPLPAEYKLKSTDETGLPLVRNSPNSELEGFSICGQDEKWVWADAKIEGDTIVVWSTSIKNPVAVRYAWADNPTCNLYNKDGLPASSFRTDDFKPKTINNRY